MTNFKHLTQYELIAYHSDSLEKNERHEIGKHLLNCAECRKLLPMPSVERFWSAVMTDSEIKGAPQREDSEKFVTSLVSFLKLQSGLLWGGAALILIFCFSFLILSGSADSSREVVQTFDNEPGSKNNFTPPMQTPAEEYSALRANPKGTEINPTPRNSKADSQKPKTEQNNSSPASKNLGLKRPGEGVSATRGVAAKCSGNKLIEAEISAAKENFVFKWKAVPKAAKYHLYISDDEEILIDEFETPDETSFVLRKPLDPLKIYKWKIIITLENGEQLIGDSQKFTTKGFQTDQKKIEKKKAAETRCSENG